MTSKSQAAQNHDNFLLSYLRDDDVCTDSSKVLNIDFHICIQGIIIK